MPPASANAAPAIPLAPLDHDSDANVLEISIRRSGLRRFFRSYDVDAGHIRLELQNFNHDLQCAGISTPARGRNDRDRRLPTEASSNAASFAMRFVRGHP